jgi:uncharacterized protein
MKYKLLEKQPRTFAIIFRTGDRLADGLKQFAFAQQIRGASFKAIGALSSVRLGWFNWQTKKYETAVALDEQVELLSMIGDIADQDGMPQVHAHVVVGKRDGTAHGGHLLEATVRPTCEVILTESAQVLQKEIDEESGLALIRL